MRKILPVLGLLASLPAAAEPIVRMHTSYYYIDGPSATVLAAQVDQTGPVGADGKHYAGKTSWDAQWRFAKEQKGNVCVVTKAQVAIGISQVMPRWRGEDKGSDSLRAAWTKFTQALQRHEDEHKEHGMKAAKEIEAAILATRPASNCEALTDTANDAARMVVEKYQKLDEELDRRTDHGRSEGATLL
ncbi:MAG TPA: DUF922 domain-containing protein [Burkholderiales bacterium]|nr:DUF922 domain-containing protein [Burkholderiales bacterium]